MTTRSAITEEMRKSIGSWQMPAFPPEVVDPWGILRYAAAIEDPNPLWRDEAYAKKTIWKGIVAPPTYAEVFNPVFRSFREIGGEAGSLIDMLPFKLPFERVFMGMEDFEFLLPVRPGDGISATGTIGDVYEKNGTSGTLLFVRNDKEYRNQKGQLLVKASWTAISAESKSAASIAPRPEVEARPLTPARINLEQLYWENIDVGTPVPPMDKHVTFATIAKWGGATGDVGRPHFDYKFVREAYGLPDVFAQGPLNGAYLAQLVTNWIGSAGILKTHSVQYRGNTFVGDVVTFSGKVTSKSKKKNENLIECETSAVNQYGQRVTFARSVVSLPTRTA